MADESKLRSIELFAGCGGMSLGFHSENYELVFANELSPMAAETFAFNLLNEDLREKGQKQEKSENVLWLSSQYKDTSILNRLNEQPLIAKKGENSDLNESTDLNHKLIVGNIIELNAFLHQHRTLIPKNIDVVSGGPPCQSFSMSGLRKKDDPKNQLPFAFAEFVELVQPKFVVLENVTGILRPFTAEDGQKYHAWIEISRYFVEKGYVPICLHINAKYVGVPQSRPRFLMIGIREDIAVKIQRYLSNTERATDKQMINDAIYFFHHSSTLPMLYDIHHQQDQYLFDRGVLSHFQNHKTKTVKDALDDLINQKSDLSYQQYLDSIFKKYAKPQQNLIANQETSNCGEQTMMRFKLYQIINKYENKDRSLIKLFLNDEEVNLTDTLLASLLKEEFLVQSKLSKFSNVEELKAYLTKLKTKKRSQVALNPNQPSPTIQSNADDLIHYEALRPITVREMARIQSFPDGFIFKSKRTTGGDRRKFEVPQQTQVGNAVPPLLAKQIAKMIADLNHLSLDQNQKERECLL